MNTTEPLYCNNSGCNLHDYPVSKYYCAYKWSLEQESRMSSDFDRLLDKVSDLVDSLTGLNSPTPTQKVTSPPVPKPAPTPSPRPSREITYTGENN